MEVQKSNWRKNHNSQIDPKTRAAVTIQIVKAAIGALIGIAVILLFSIVVFAFVIKAFTATSDEMAFRLLNTAIALVASTLGGVIGFYLGKNSSRSD